MSDISKQSVQDQEAYHCTCDHPTPKGRMIERCAVIANSEIAPGVWELQVESPQLAGLIRPGQFVHLSLERDTAHLLRRPFSIYLVEGQTVHIMYQVVGAISQEMTTLCQGEHISMMGPLGRGWSPPADAQKVLFVTGGLGAAPLGLLARELRDRGVETHVAMGAPSSLRLVGRKHYESQGCGVHVATDDGTAGLAGFCTQIAADLLRDNDYDYVATCGPEPMQKIVAGLARDADVNCQVSLERLMACGIGACLSCVVQTAQGQKRACFDGPVFDAEVVIWDE